MRTGFLGAWYRARLSELVAVPLTDGVLKHVDVACAHGTVVVALPRNDDLVSGDNEANVLYGEDDGIVSEKNLAGGEQIEVQQAHVADRDVERQVLNNGTLVRKQERARAIRVDTHPARSPERKTHKQSALSVSGRLFMNAAYLALFAALLRAARETAARGRPSLGTRRGLVSLNVTLFTVSCSWAFPAIPWRIEGSSPGPSRGSESLESPIGSRREGISSFDLALFFSKLRSAVLRSG